MKVSCFCQFLLLATLLIQTKASSGGGGGDEDAGPQDLGADLDEDSMRSCHWREFDLCSIGAFSLFQNPNGLAQSELELRRQCELLNESVRCFNQYANKCLTEMQSKLFRWFGASGSRLVGDFCSAQSELRRNYTKHVQCLRLVQRDFQRPCMTDFQVGLESIHRANLSTRLITGCCNLNRLKECIFRPVEYECGLGAEETLGRVIESLSGGLLAFSCRDYDPSGPKCAPFLSKPGARPKGSRSSSALSKIISSFTNVPARN